jgi:formyltetrahydrofolate deformylase
VAALPVEIIGGVSNHETARSRTEWHGLANHYPPINTDSKAEQEARFSALID